MATVRQTIERLRESGKLPQSGAVSVRGLHQQFRPAPAGSTRALVSTMFGGVSERVQWAVILCRFKGAAPDPALEGPLPAILS